MTKYTFCGFDCISELDEFNEFMVLSFPKNLEAHKLFNICNFISAKTCFIKYITLNFGFVNSIIVNHYQYVIKYLYIYFKNTIIAVSTLWVASEQWLNKPLPIQLLWMIHIVRNGGSQEFIPFE